MPRMPRLDLEGVAQHVVQRGNDRQACFFRDADYERYLRDLRESAVKHDCSVHAYVLMTNHVHLLVTPQRCGGVARMMQAVGRRYDRYVNDALCRTGTLWEGRYKSCLVDNEHYVLACYRYIELNPVRARMVADPAAYRWSSYHANALGTPDPLITPNPVRHMASDEVTRRALYAELVAEGIRPEDIAVFQLYTQRQRALGSSRFQDQIERQLLRPAALGRPGRPRRTRSEDVL